MDILEEKNLLIVSGKSLKIWVTKRNNNETYLIYKLRN